MKTENVEELLWKYIDGSCSDQESRQIKSMIDQNESVADLYKMLSSIDSGLQSTLITPAPDSLKENILTQLQQKPMIEPAQFKIVPVMLLTLILLAITVFFLPSSSEPTGVLSTIDWSIFEWNLSLPQGYSVYIFGAIAAVALVWMDRLFVGKMRIHF